MATVAERRAEIKANKYRRTAQEQYKEALEYAKRQTEAEVKSNANAAAQRKEAGFAKSSAHTLWDIGGSLLTGTGKSVEGIVDLLIGVGGAVGGIFDEDIKDGAKRAIQYDVTGKLYGDAIQDLTKYSYLNGNKVGETVEAVAEGLGGMLPTVIVGIATGGTSVAAQAAATATMVAGAAGQGVEEAFNDGADYGEGMLYGVGSGAVEAATEQIFGLNGIGKGFADNAVKGVAKQGLKRVAKEAAEEGVEEIAAELANPLLKTVYKGSDALKEYGSADYWRGVGEAGAVGALTGAAYGQTVGRALNRLHGTNDDISASLEAVGALNEQQTRLEADGRLSADKYSKIQMDIKENLQNVESVLKNTSAENRARYVESYGLDGIFDSDGALSREVAASYDRGVAVGREGAVQRFADSELWSEPNTLVSDLSALTQQLTESGETLGEVRLFEGELSETGERAYRDLRRAVNKLRKKAGAELRVSIVDKASGFNGATVDGRNIYINVDTLENGSWSGTLTHELTHFSEGSSEYSRLRAFLLGNEELSASALAELIEEGNAYGFTSADVSGERTEAQPVGVQYSKKSENENQKRVTEWEKHTRLRLPVRHSSDNSIYSISHSDENINGKSKKSTEKISVDTDGKRVYNNSVDMTDGERAALLAYKSSESYLMNVKLREGINFSGDEKSVLSNLDSALEKLPVYRGKVYRNIRLDGFGDGAARDAVVREHIIGKSVTYDAYTSTSTASDGYVLEGKYVVHFEIESVNGRDMDGYGNNTESEILFARESRFITENITFDKDGTPTIYLREIEYGRQKRKDGIDAEGAVRRNNERTVRGDNTGESRSPDHDTEKTSMQRLYTSGVVDGQLQILSRRNTEGGFSGERNLRGVRAEVDEQLGTVEAREQYLLEAVGMLAHADEATLTERQRSLLNECTALSAEKLLGGDGRFVGRLLRSDATLAARLINKLHDTAEMLSSLGTAEANREYTRLREAERLFLSAVENAGMTYRNGKIAVTDDGDKKEEAEAFTNAEKQKKSRETSVSPALQLPGAMTNIDSAISIHQNGDVVNTNFEKKVQYSKKPFPKQVDDVLGGADVISTHLKLMQTPQILRDVGLPDLPLLMTARHLKTITASFGNYRANYHGLDTELVKKLPQYLSSPVMIADSLTRRDSVVIVTEALDAEARPVIAAVLLNGTGRLDGEYIQANIMTSAYGKDNIQSFISRLSDNGKVLYWNEKKCRELAEYLELRLPKALTDIVPDTVVRRTAAFTEANKQRKSRQPSVKPELQLLDIVTDIDSDNSIHQNESVVNTISEKKVRLSKKILDDMSETQRAEILKELVIIPSEVSLPDSLGVDYGALENGAWKQVKKALTERLRELGCLTLYESRAANVDFRFTGEGLRKSANSQLHDYGGSLADLATVVTNLKPLIDNAVLLESHSDKARGTPRENGQLLRTYVLLSAYHNEGGITPVQLEIKQYVDDNNRLYLAVALTKTKTEADVVNDTASEAPMPTRLVPASAISIPQLINKINPADENFFKYVPNEFLTAEQLAAKQNAIAREARKYQKKSRETSVNPELQLLDIVTNTDSDNSIHKNESVVNTISEKKLQFSKSSGSERKRLTEELMKKLNALNDAELGKFSAASVYKNDSLERAMNVMASLARKETVGASELRAGMRELRTWYSKENKLLGYENDGNSGFYREDIAERLDTLSEGKSRLSVDELSMMNDVVAHLTKISQTWDKTYRDGRWQDTKELAGEYLTVLKRSEGVRAGMAASLASSRLQRQFGDPASVFRAADKYEPHGFFTESFEQLRRAAVNTDIMKMELKASYESFLREHKDYKKRLTTAEATYMGKRLSVGELISLYLTHDRPQAFEALVENGFVLEHSDKREKTVTELGGIAGKRDGAYGADELRAYIEDSKRSIEAQLTPVDREFIDEVRKIYSECAVVKHDADIERFGYSSISERGAYYPLRRYDIAKSFGGSDYMREADSASGMPFNRRTVKSRARLLIEPVHTVLERHVGGISLYANFSSTAEGLSRILNADTSNGGGVPRSLLSELKRTEYYRETLELLRTLSSDVEGKRQTSDRWYTDKVRFIRSSYAKYQLGANPKVLTSQWSSLLAAGSILDYSSIIEGMRVPDKLAEVDEYCPLAKLRNTDNTAIKAETVTDKVGKAGELLMYHIGYMDRRVVAVLFGACQVQVQKDAGLKLGTAENKKAAGELLERVILETQQNYIATERSAAMRSSDELLKGLVMFSADSMKITGRVIDAFGECSVLRARLKAAETTGADVKKMRTRYDKARKKAARAASSLMASAVFLASMSLMFKGLYGKLRDEEERDEAFEDFVADIFGNMLGGMPIVRDVYSALVEGYDMDMFLVGSFNDLVNSFSGIAELAQNALNGKDVTRQQAARGTRSVAYALGQLFGVPVRNIFNVATGVPSGISAAADYRIDDTFYKKSYSADLKDAVDRDDEKLQEIITGLMLREAGNGYDDTAQAALSELLKQGYSVLPQSIGDTVSRNGETVKLERSEQKRLRESYARAQAEINSLTRLSAFRNAAPDVQARAIRLLNSWYYTMALSEVLGEGEKSKAELFAAGLELYRLALIIATAESLEAERDSNGRPISGSRKSKVMEYIEAQELTAAQKHMAAGWLGYRNSKGEDKVRAYIATLALGREEKSRLLKYSGYAA